MSELTAGDHVWWLHLPDQKLHGTVEDITDSDAVIGCRTTTGELLYLLPHQLFPEPLGDGVHPASLGYTPDPTRLSPNGAKKLLGPGGPAKFDWARRHPQKTKPAWDFGIVAHKLVLGEGDQFLVLDPEIHGLKKDGMVADNPRATATWKTAESNAREEGLTPIHADDYHKAMEMAQVVHQHETAGPLLAEGDAEVWLYATDPDTGQRIRLRADWITRKDGRTWIVDYKTAADASPETFGRRSVDYGYHIQAAFSIVAARALGLDKNPRCVFICQDKEPPYLPVVNELDAEALSLGCRRMREAIAIYQRCIETCQWPGYPLGINQIALPAWAIDEEMEFSA